MALTPDEQQRILDEEKARNDARKQIKREENQRKNKKDNTVARNILCNNDDMGSI